MSRLWPVAVVYLLFAAGYIAYITYLSAYLVGRHASTLETTLTWLVLGAGVIAAPLVWRRPIARWPGGRLLAAVLAGIAGAAAIVLVSPAPAVVVVSAVAYGATFMGVPTAVTALARASTVQKRLPATLSAFTVIFAVGQMVGPWLAGMLADRTSAAATLAWTAVLCGAGAVVAPVAVRGRTETRIGSAGR